MRVTIRKMTSSEGTWYEIEDFPAYVEALKARGIEPPKARYRIFVPFEVEAQFRLLYGDLESQVAVFYRLGPSSGIDYAIAAPDALREEQESRS